MSDRVLVPMSRSEAEWYDALGERTGQGPTHRPIRAALDTDREKLVERVAVLLGAQTWIAVEDCLGDAAEVLALLENGGQE